jgi:hypothetical protein
MKIFRHIYIFLSITVIFSGCISEFDPPSQDYENLLVVEAFLTNDGEPFEVILSRSTPIDTIAFIPESGANISLETEMVKAMSYLNIRRENIRASPTLIHRLVRIINSD